MRVVGEGPSRPNPFTTESIEPAQVAVVDDHLLVGRLVVGLIQGAGYSAELTFGDSVEDTWSLVMAAAPELILLDFDLGSMQSSFEILERAVEARITVAGFTASDDRLLEAAYLEAGAAVVISKACGPADLIALVELAVAGQELMAPADRHASLSRLRKTRETKRRETAVFSSLTVRESETLQLITEGYGASEIAATWDIALPTVRSHIRAVLSKLGVSSQLAAAAMARDSDWYAKVTSSASSILTMPTHGEAGTIARRSGFKG